MLSSTHKLPYTICTPWQLPDACSRTINRYCLYSSISESCNKEENNKQGIMKSSDFNHQQPSRHIALQSNAILSVGHSDLFKALRPFEIRCIYPYITAGITIISFYKLSSAQQGMEIIQSQFSHLYTTCFVKPCLINKNLNESIFVTIRYKSITAAAESKFDYLSKISPLDSIYSLSEATITNELKVLNIEFDDERTSRRVLQEYHDKLIDKDIVLQSYEATNNQLMCSCHKKKDLRWNQQDTLPTCFLNSKFIEVDNTDENKTSSDNGNSNTNKIYYSKDHENHSFFSADPFSLNTKMKRVTVTSIEPTTTINEMSSNSSTSGDEIDVISSSSSSTTSDNSVWKRSKREFFDSSMLTCTPSSSTTFSTSATKKELRNNSIDLISTTTTSDENNVNSDLEYIAPTISSGSPTASDSSASLSTDSSTAKTVVSSKKPVNHGKKSKDEKNNDFSLENIISGKDTRTTFMIRNIPNKYTQQMLMDCINETHTNTYDFLYLRIDFKNKCNVGYAFINFINVESVISFYKNRDGKKWKLFNSDKKCSLSYANIQGKEALIRKFKNSQVMDEDATYKPKLFYTEGVNKGKEQPFPKPDDNLHSTSLTDNHGKQPKNYRSRYQRKRC